MLRIAALLLGALLPAMAWGQQALEPEYALKLKQSQLATLETVLAKTRNLPVSWEEINSVLQTIVKQVEPQVQAANDEAAKTAKPPEAKP